MPQPKDGENLASISLSDGATSAEWCQRKHFEEQDSGKSETKGDTVTAGAKRLTVTFGASVREPRNAQNWAFLLFRMAASTGIQVARVPRT